MNRITFAMISSVIALVGLLWLLISDSSNALRTQHSGSSLPVMLYCAASNKAVVDSVKADYERETGRKLEVMYGASQVLLSSLEVSRSGDLYLPADDSYLKLGREKSLIGQVLPVAGQRAVVAVRKGNPLRIQAFEDLLRPDVRVVQALPDAAAIGRVTKIALQERGLWEQLNSATTAYRVTVSEVANDILVDAADAGLVYDAVLHTYPQLEYVELPELHAAVSDVSVGVLSFSKQPEHALHFARYLSARDRGLRRYAEFGFTVKAGDAWAEDPEISSAATGSK